MTTTIISKDRQKILEGLNKTADIVRATMGADGKNVIITDDTGILRFTKDGVSVARSIRLPDALENIGASVAITTSEKTVGEVGDGTSLTILLLQELVTASFLYLEEDPDVNVFLKHLENEVEAIIKYLRKNSIPVDSLQELYNIAKTSSNSEDIGDFFRQIYTEVGFDSFVSLERGDIDSTEYEVIDGVEFNSGYVHPTFLTDHQTSLCVYENVKIHIDPNPISIISDQYKDMFDAALNTQEPVLIMAPRFSDAFIRACSMNKVNANLPVCLVRSPGYAAGIDKNYDDIKAFLSEDGKVDKIVVSDSSLKIFNANPHALEKRIKHLELLSETALEHYDREDYFKRLHKLKQSTAIVYAGGITPEAREEEFDRIEDALGAVCAAVSGGYSPGAGMAFYNYARKGVANPTNKREEILNLFLKILRIPAEQILKNANIVPEKILKNTTDIKGFDVKKKEYCQILSRVTDPTEVLVQSIQNAFSSTKLLINTSYAIFNIYNTNKQI